MLYKLLLLFVLSVITANAQANGTTSNQLNNSEVLIKNNKQDAREVSANIGPAQVATQSADAAGNLPTRTDPNWRMADYTCLIMIFTGLNFFALLGQTIILWKTVRATEKAAKAAKESADALPKIERAYMFVEIASSTFYIVENATQNSSVTIKVIFKNHGKTPAIIRQVHVWFEVLQDYPSPDYDETSIMPKGIVVSSGDTREPEYSSRKLTPDEQKDILHGVGPKLMCYGRIVYEDVLKKERKTGFCWEYKPNIGYSISDNSKLNYYT